jgi:hypothetical protein
MKMKIKNIKLFTNNFAKIKFQSSNFAERTLHKHGREPRGCTKFEL